MFITAQAERLARDEQNSEVWLNRNSMLRRALAVYFLSGETMDKVPTQNKGASSSVSPRPVLGKKEITRIMPSESKNRTNYTEHNPSETKETTKKKSDQNTRQFS